MAKVLKGVEFESKDYWLSQDSEQQSIPLTFLFAREAWRGVIEPEQTEWLDQMKTDLESRKDRDDLYSLRFLPEKPDLLSALSTLKAQGVDEKALSFLIREMQKNTLYHLSSLLDGGHCFHDGLVSDWGVFEMNDSAVAKRQFLMLCEMLHELDPAGEEE